MILKHAHKYSYVHQLSLNPVPFPGYQFMFRARMCHSLIFDRVEDWDQRTVHSCAKHKLEET